MKTYKAKFICECRSLSCTLNISDQSYYAYSRDRRYIQRTSNFPTRILSNKCAYLKNRIILRKGKECTIVQNDI